MKNKTAKNSNGKSATKATKAAAKLTKVTKATKAARKTKPARFFLFDTSISKVVAALGKLGWKPAAAIAAVHAKLPAVKASAIRNMLFAGRKGIGTEPAKLTRPQLAQLKKLAGAAA